MGLRKYGGGRRNKILKDFVKNKTGRQVEKHATSFFINFLQTYLNSCVPAIACNNNNKTDLMATLASVLNPNPKNNQMKEEEEEGIGQPPTLIPFSNGEAGCSRDVISEVANTTRSCVNVDDDDDEGEVDLELRLGCNRY
ncbi:uncharacterized protein LOC114758439 [Neltuma alba]|uniref:uncharacterized protein LOC114758439 n=1 Tax=Neltuma alba TaxID=207710 RepID=UPI0010A4523E|nr:uncharacterized protein LOC114758439 [Prosopis alba]